MSKLIKGVGVHPFHDPHELYVPNELDQLLRYVGGYIETVHVTDGVILICNEEGKIRRLEFTDGVILICNEEGKIRRLEWNFDLGDDSIVGPVLFLGDAGEEFRSLTEEEIQKVKELIEEGRS